MKSLTSKNIPNMKESGEYGNLRVNPNIKYIPSKSGKYQKRNADESNRYDERRHLESFRLSNVILGRGYV